MRKSLMKKRFSSIVMALILAMSAMSPMQALAAETAEISSEQMEVNNTIEPRAGVETLPLGEYSIGNFTFVGTNTTPVKTIPAGASQMQIYIIWKKADAKAGNVKLKFQVRDTSGNALSPMYTKTAGTNYVQFYTDYISVTPGKKIQFYFAAESENSVEQRTANIGSFTSYIH